MSENHCVDCCCARSWKALGIVSYTGKSIPEHIEELRTALLKAVETFDDMQRVLRLLGRPILADACAVAADGSRNAVYPLQHVPTTVETGAKHGT